MEYVQYCDKWVSEEQIVINEFPDPPYKTIMVQFVTDAYHGGDFFSDLIHYLLVVIR